MLYFDCHHSWVNRIETKQFTNRFTSNSKVVQSSKSYAMLCFSKTGDTIRSKYDCFTIIITIMAQKVHTTGGLIQTDT